ncbi:MAG: ATP-grasp domain-containing protein [Acidimicrobiia bacterium]|nr:ATP-grasp domain-containing protein [Acidimicrobiia bacterium]
MSSEGDTLDMPDTVSLHGDGDKPAVILLGGAENAVACARRFTRAGIETVAVNRDAAAVLSSRGVIRASTGTEFTRETTTAWLAGDGRRWEGAVVIPLSDHALLGLLDDETFARETYRLATFDSEVALAMLDKQTTLELAREAGIAVPRQWAPPAEGPIPFIDELTYPLIMKPRRNFELARRTGWKHVHADSRADVDEHLALMRSLPSGFVFNEFVQGPDELLSSYYAVRSEDGETLLEFTKTVDRRYPTNQGGATFHRLVDLPETAEAGRSFFEHIGLTGVGNVEFKTDPQTRELKLMECNYRLTAATTLVQDAGIDLAGAIYDQALGRAVEPCLAPEWGATMWYPIRDLRSFLAAGAGIRPWLERPKRSSYPYWRFDDPGPTAKLARRYVASRFRS